MGLEKNRTKNLGSDVDEWKGKTRSFGQTLSCVFSEQNKCLRQVSDFFFPFVPFLWKSK